MANFTRKKAVVILQDGTIFWGRSVGLEGTSTGEICFNTGMTGYQEIFTDPSYYGQLMVTTNAHIGNYGIKEDEVESDSIKIAGLICKNFSFHHSRPGANDSLLKYFEDKEFLSDLEKIKVVSNFMHLNKNKLLTTSFEPRLRLSIYL